MEKTAPPGSTAATSGRGARTSHPDKQEDSLGRRSSGGDAGGDAGGQASGRALSTERGVVLGEASQSQDAGDGYNLSRWDSIESEQVRLLPTTFPVFDICYQEPASRGRACCLSHVELLPWKAPFQGTLPHLPTCWQNATLNSTNCIPPLQNTSHPPPAPNHTLLLYGRQDLYRRTTQAVQSPQSSRHP